MDFLKTIIDFYFYSIPTVALIKISTRGSVYLLLGGRSPNNIN